MRRDGKIAIALVLAVIGLVSLLAYVLHSWVIMYGLLIWSIWTALTIVKLFVRVPAGLFRGEKAELFSAQDTETQNALLRRWFLLESAVWSLLAPGVAFLAFDYYGRFQASLYTSLYESTRVCASYDRGLRWSRLASGSRQRYSQSWFPTPMYV